MKLLNNMKLYLVSNNKNLMNSMTHKKYKTKLIN